jgi:hypothetical protein
MDASASTRIAAAVDGAHTVVLVEGDSDRRAVEVLAARRGWRPAGGDVAILAMGGATNFAAYLRMLATCTVPPRVMGLVDEAETAVLLRALERVGRGHALTSDQLPALGFQVCVRDLEDELIRALGVTAVEKVLAEQGDLDAFRTFQKQPAQRGRTDEARLRRFLGTKAGRKLHYAEALAAALSPTELPPPLDRLLTELERHLG